MKEENMWKMLVLAGMILSFGVKTGFAAEDTHKEVMFRSLIQAGNSALYAKSYDLAIDRFESSAALFPGKSDPFIGLGRVAKARKLPGKAIRFYSKALKREPRNQIALEEQGKMFLVQGGFAWARENLEKLKKICKDQVRCTTASRLHSAIILADMEKKKRLEKARREEISAGLKKPSDKKPSDKKPSDKKPARPEK